MQHAATHALPRVHLAGVAALAEHHALSVSHSQTRQVQMRTAGANEDAVPAAADVAAGQPMETPMDKKPFAFSKCINVQHKNMSSYSAECLICGKKVLAWRNLLFVDRTRAPVASHILTLL